MGNQLVTGTRALLSMSGIGAVVDTDTGEIEGTVPISQFTKPPLIIFTEPFFKLQRTQDKGFGLFAARSIPRGTRIIEESPLLAMPHEQGCDLSAINLENALQGLNREQRGKFFELHRNRGLSSQESQELTNLNRGGLADAAAIFEANCVEMSEINTTRAGVFEHYSRINHACNPNVHNSYNLTLGKLTVHAIQQINKGEEILTSYIDGTCKTRQQRQKILIDWGFECGCKTCTGPKAAASDERRGRMFDMTQQLAFYAAGQRQTTGSPVPSGPTKALELAKDLLKLYNFEGITDLSLVEIYLHCSTYSLQLGHFDEAVDYAKRLRDVERYCIGTGDLLLANGMHGAGSWLEHVLSKREEEKAQRQAAEELSEEETAHETEMAQPKKNAGKGKKKGGKGKKKGGKGKKK